MIVLAAIIRHWLVTVAVPEKVTLLTGKYSGGRIPEQSRGNDPKRNRWMGGSLDNDVLGRVDELKALAAGVGISTAQLALAWCLRRPNISSVIIGATRSEQLEENVKAVGVELPAEVTAAIDERFPGPDATATVGTETNADD